MTRKILLSISLLSTGLCLAAPLTPEEALSRLNSNGLEVGTRSAASLKPTLIKTTGIGEPALYVFESKDTPGFMVVSADDAITPLLGYSDFNNFDTENISPAMENWLDQYSRQIEYVRENNLATRSGIDTRVSLPAWSAVGPLVRTQWNQGEPYNNMCPLVGNTHCYTGCVATAMSQVMNYFKYPEKGQGEITYECSSDAAPCPNRDLYLDFSKLTFDWANMLNNYNGNNDPQVNKDAVATLMMAAGYSVQMTYTTNQSGAISGYIPGALVKYFNYDKGATYVPRTLKTYTEWATLIYNNIKNVGPVIYDGDTAGSGGHSFVCDGYDGNGYFHFNWGWGGSGDGYFLLDSLDPSSIGIGGALGGFDYRQDIIINIQKPKSSTQAEQSEIILAGSAEGYTSSSYLYFKIYGSQYPGFRYIGTSSMTFDIGVSVVPVNEPNSTPKYVACANNSTFKARDMPLDPGFVIYTAGNSTRYPYPMYTFSNLGLSDNVKYKITAAYRPEGGDWKEMSAGVGCYNYFYVTKSGNNYTFENFPQMQFTCDNLSLASDLYYTKAVEVNLSLSNKNDSQLTRSAILVLINDKDEIEFMGDSFVESLNPGETLTKSYVTALSKQTMSQFNKATSYYLGLLDYDTQTIYYKSANPVTMQPSPGAATFDCNFTIVNGQLQDPPQYSAEVYEVENSQVVEVEIDIDVINGIFTSEVQIYGGVANVGGQSPISLLNNFDLKILNAGETGVYKATLNCNDADPGELYLLVPYIGGQQMADNTIGFIAAKNESGINQIVDLDSEILMIYDKFNSKIIAKGAKNIEVYSLNGMKLSSNVTYSGEGAELDLSSLGKGIVVVTAKDKNGNLKTLKLAL